jgi:hypothetical protein
VDIRSIAASRAARSAHQPEPDRTCRRRAGLAVVAAVAAIGLAACGGPSSPQVANLGKSSSGTATAGNSAASGSAGNPTKLLDEWAACMRSHGDPDQADPTIDARRVIQVIIPLNAPKGAMASSGAQSCQSLLTAASTSLRGGPPPAPDPAKELKFAECMRANGVPAFPDPSSDGGLSLNAGSGVSLNNPSVRNAATVCVKQTGVSFLGVGTPPAGTVMVRTQAAIDAGLVPGGNGGSGGHG